MHLDRGLALVPTRLVRESVERKIAVEFTIDAGEKIEIERRGHATGVIVCRDQCLDVFAQVDADDRLAALTDMLAHPAKQGHGVGRQQIAERAPRKKRDARTRRHIGRNVKVGGEIRDDRPHRQIEKPILNPLDRLGEKIRRNVDRRIHPRRTKRIDEDFRLDRRAGAVFEQHRALAAQVRHLACMAPKNRRLGPRQIIFVEAGDLLEQLRAALVVEPAARKRLLPLRKTREHVGSKRFVLAEFGFNEVEHLKRLPLGAAPRTAISRRAERNCDKRPACGRPESRTSRRAARTART